MKDHLAYFCEKKNGHLSPFNTLITTSCQVWSRWTYPLPYYSVFAADTLLYVVTLTFEPVTLTYDLWPWTFEMYRLWDDENLYQIWTQSSYLQRSYCDFNIWPYDLELHVALGSGIIFTKFDRQRLLRAWIIAFLMLIRYVTLWPWPKGQGHVKNAIIDLDSSWCIKRHVQRQVCTKFERNWAIPGWIIANLANFCTRYVTLWPWPLTSWLWTLSALRVSCRSCV